MTQLVLTRAVTTVSPHVTTTATRDTTLSDADTPHYLVTFSVPRKFHLYDLRAENIGEAAVECERVNTRALP
jgi:hypothetical protein